MSIDDGIKLLPFEDRRISLPARRRTAYLCSSIGRIGMTWRSTHICLLIVAFAPWHAVAAQEQPGISSVQSDGNVITLENPIIKTIETFSIASEVSGILTKMLVSEGDEVQAGDVIAQLRDDEVQLNLAKAKLELDSARRRKTSDIDIQLAEKAAAVAETELKRAEKANTIVANTYPQNEIDRFRLGFDKAVLEIQRANHEKDLLGIGEALAINQVKRMELFLSQHSIRAPLPAMVVAIDKRPGEWIEPGVKIIQLVTIDKLRVEGLVKADNASLMVRGMPATVWVKLGENEMKVAGKLAFVSPDANPVSRLVRVYLEIDNEQRLLRPGLEVRAEVTAAPLMNAAQVR